MRNCLCKIDKYSRVAHPEFNNSEKDRIKQHLRITPYIVRLMGSHVCLGFLQCRLGIATASVPSVVTIKQGVEECLGQSGIELGRGLICFYTEEIHQLLDLLPTTIAINTVPPPYEILVDRY